MTEMQADIVKYVLGKITEPTRVYIDGIRMHRIELSAACLKLAKANGRVDRIPCGDIVNVRTECTVNGLKLVVTDNYYVDRTITVL